MYDDAQKRYDHHQRGFSEVFGHGFKTKLSSAGLIYKWAIKHFRFLETQSQQALRSTNHRQSVWIGAYGRAPARNLLEDIRGIRRGAGWHRQWHLAVGSHISRRQDSFFVQVQNRLELQSGQGKAYFKSLGHQLNQRLAQPCLERIVQRRRA